MPIAAVLLIELPAPIDESDLVRLRDALVRDLHLQPDDFYIDGPLRPVQTRLEGPIPTSGRDKSYWLNANLWQDYYDPKYPRGDIQMIVRCADWIDAHLPGCRVWYGHDIDDDGLIPFTLGRRRELLRHAMRPSAEADL